MRSIATAALLIFSVQTAEALGPTCDAPVQPMPIASPPSNGDFATNVRNFNAKGDGVTDDSVAFKAAVAATPTGGIVHVPVGNYVVSQTITIDRPLSIIGTGLGTQIYSTTGAPIIRLRNVNGVTLRGLYLGSVSSGPCSMLIHVAHSHHNQIEDVTMLGASVGLYLNGSLLNTVVNLRSGINVGGFFTPNMPTNDYWVVADRFNDQYGDKQNIASNGNHFITPRLEGGTYGLLLKDNNAEGSIVITGGTIEGLSKVGLVFENSFLPSSVTGVHFESNVVDISVRNSSHLRFSAITALPDLTKAERVSLIEILGDSRNIQITDSLIAVLNVDPSAKRVVLQNITFGTAGVQPTLNYCAFTVMKIPPVTVAQTPATPPPYGPDFSMLQGNTPTNPLGPLLNITAMNVGNFCGGE